MKNGRSLDTCNILGVNISVTDMREVVTELTNNLDEYRGKYICVSNVHTTVMSYEDEQYKNIQNRAAMAIPDGKPLSLLCRKRGFKKAKRVAGPDLMTEILGLSVHRGYKHYFYGSTESTLEQLKEKLEGRYPGIEIVGMYSPPFREITKEEDQAVVEEVRQSCADYVWIGLGAPKQERWMFLHENCFNGVMLGVGAAFDFHAGTVKRAPRWMQEWCLEWLFRLFQDPKRLFKRYVHTNLKFIWLIIIKRKNV